MIFRNFRVGWNSFDYESIFWCFWNFFRGILLHKKKKIYIYSIAIFPIDLYEFALWLQRTPINYLLVNLAICDILFATFITPKIVVSFNITHPDGTAGSVLCKLVTGGNLAWLPGITSVVTLVAIAVERYYTALYPLDPKRKLTYRKFKVSQNIPIDLPGENTVWGLWPAVIEKESFISIFWSVRRLIFTSLDLRIRHRNLYLKLTITSKSLKKYQGKLTWNG